MTDRAERVHERELPGMRAEGPGEAVLPSLDLPHPVHADAPGEILERLAPARYGRRCRRCRLPLVAGVHVWVLEACATGVIVGACLAGVIGLLA